MTLMTLALGTLIFSTLGLAIIALFRQVQAQSCFLQDIRNRLEVQGEELRAAIDRLPKTRARKSRGEGS